MKQRRHTPEQIIRKLREAERLQAEGADIATVARHLEVSEQTFHRWRAQYGGMKADDAKRLKELERENAPAQAHRGRPSPRYLGLEGGGEGKLVSPARRRRAVWMLMDRLAISERRACRAIGQPRTTQRRGIPVPTDEEQVHPGPIARAGPGPSPLWLSADDGAPAHRGILRQPQAHPAPVPG